MIIILTSALLLAGCVHESKNHERPDIIMAADSAAYIEMLEKEIT